MLGIFEGYFYDNDKYAQWLLSSATNISSFDRPITLKVLKYSRDKIRPKIKFWVEQIVLLFQDALATDLIVFVDKCGFLAFFDDF